jgi:membrane-bound lytic murein transglycosylase D
LLVTRGAHKNDDVSEQVADNASINLAVDGPSKRRVNVKVGAKDTLTSVAKRHRVSVAQLREWNQLDAKATLKAGESLVLFLPHRAGKKSANTRATAASAKSSKPVRKTAASASGKRPAAHASGKSTQRSQHAAKK